MADFKTQTFIEARAVIAFNEAELRALDALTGYGADSFLKVFYEHMGKSYMGPHEAGLRSLFKTIGAPVSRALREVDEARKLINAGALKPRIRVVG